MTEHRFRACPHCDLIIEGEARFCPHCGKDMTQAPSPAAPPSTGTASGAGRCPLCRKPIHGEATCPHCGWELVAGPSTAEGPGLMPEEPKVKKSRWLRIGVPVLALAVLAAVWSLVFELLDNDEETPQLYDAALDIAGQTGQYDSYGVSFIIPENLPALSETDMTSTQQASASSGFVMLSTSGRDYMVGVGWLVSPSLAAAPLSETINTEIYSFALIPEATVADLGPETEIPFMNGRTVARTFHLTTAHTTTGGAIAAGLCAAENRVIELICMDISGTPGPFSELSPTSQETICMDNIRVIVATLDC